MTSDKLRKYLAYYQKTLREEPDNIEARLRLAAIFRDMGREAHAVEEYVTAAKLLAREGLPLEAIAACKAVLELEPQHTETQLFLARLYARVPDVAGGTARIARPVEVEPNASRRGSGPHQTADASQAGAHNDDQPITLSQPKRTATPSRDLPFQRAAESRTEDETTVAPSGLIEPESPTEEHEDQTAVADRPVREADISAEFEPTRRADAAELPDLEEFRITEEQDTTRPAASAHQIPDRMTVEMPPSDRESVLSAMAGSSSNQDADDAEMRTTLDVDDDDILAGDVIEATEAPTDERAPERTRKATMRLDQHTQATRLQRKQTMAGLPGVTDDPDTAELEGLDGGEWQETFEVGVFDMESLQLDRESTGDWDDLSFLDDLDEPNTEELAGRSEVDDESAFLSVDRSDLPEIPLFSQLEPHVFMQLLRIIDFKEVPAGTAIVEPGRTKRSLFVIVRGTTAVSRRLDDGSVVELARMSEGEFFGEFALLTGRSQMATVSAQNDVALLEISEEVIERLATEKPDIWDILWDFYHARMLNNLLASSTIFRSLDDRQRNALVDRFALEEVPAGELLLGKGEHDYDLYLICHGEVRVERPRMGDQPETIDTLREGEFLGLISSAEEEPVVANLRAVEDATLLVLPGNEFRRVMRQNPLVEREVRRMVRERKATAGQYTSGVTSYAELGVAPRRQADSAE